MTRRRPSLRDSRASFPPLPPGLPIVWTAHVAVQRLRTLLVDLALAPGRPYEPRQAFQAAILPLAAELGLRWGGAADYKRWWLPCPQCGRRTRRLFLHLEQWACAPCYSHHGPRCRHDVRALTCDRRQVTWVDAELADYVFALRLGCTGKPLGRWHRTLCTHLARLAGRARSYRDMTSLAIGGWVLGLPRPWPAPLAPGPLTAQVGEEVLDVFLREFVHPAAYRRLCLLELAGRSPLRVGRQGQPVANRERVRYPPAAC